MYKKTILAILIMLSFDLLKAQAMCVPNNLNATQSNRSVSLSWRHVNDASGDDLIFLECFPQCAIPNTATIAHEVDNGGGGCIFDRFCIAYVNPAIFSEIWVKDNIE